MTAVYSHHHESVLFVGIRKYNSCFPQSLNTIRNVVYHGSGKGIIPWYFCPRDKGQGKETKRRMFLKGPSPCNTDHSRKSNESTPRSGEALCCQSITSPVVWVLRSEKWENARSAFCKQLTSQNSASADWSHPHIVSLPDVWATAY